MIPVFCQRATLKTWDKEYCDCPGDCQRRHDGGCFSERWDTEDTTIEKDDRQFDGRTRENIDKLVRQEYLSDLINATFLCTISVTADLEEQSPFMWLQGLEMLSTATN